MEAQIINHPTHSIDAFLKVSEILVNISQSMETDSCGVIYNENNKAILKNIEQVSLEITNCLKDVYIKNYIKE